MINPIKIMGLAVIAVLIAAAPLVVQSQSDVFFLEGADAYMLIEMQTGLVIAEHQSKKELYPASTTKILTAILALERSEPHALMTASIEAIQDIGPSGMHIGIKPDEQIPMEALLYAMMVVSANEAANIVAENVAEDREQFIEWMNILAREIGAENSNFTNVNGRHQDEHVSTASDLALIARYAMQNPAFRTMARTSRYDMPKTNMRDTWNPLYTTNIMLRTERFDGYTVTGIKSGYTNPAGRCLITSAVNDRGIELIAVVMGVREGDMAQTLVNITDGLLRYGFATLCSVDLVRKDVFLGLVDLPNAHEARPLVLLAKEDVTVCVLEPVDENLIETRIELQEGLTVPIEKGQQVGIAFFQVGERVLGQVDVMAGNHVLQKAVPETETSKTESVQTTVYGSQQTGSDTHNEMDNAPSDPPLIQFMRTALVILGVVIGVVLLFYLVLAAALVMKRKRKNRRK